jgi:hypothetical protein
MFHAVDIHMFLEGNATIFFITAVAGLSLILLQILHKPWVPVPKAEVRNGVIRFGAFQAPNSFWQTILLDAFIEAFACDLFCRDPEDR